MTGFQPTLPARGATRIRHAALEQVDFNPRSPRGERPARVRNGPREIKISTHAPREGSDSSAARYRCSFSISTHAPREGSDRCIRTPAPTGTVFQPTLPARGATLRPPRCSTPSEFQPTLPARGATMDGDALFGDGGISTHAPREGSDFLLVGHHPRVVYFNPRSPRGERPLTLYEADLITWISTHAPREGSDHRLRRTHPAPQYFNPRSPRGERQVFDFPTSPLSHFNPRSPRGERRLSLRVTRGYDQFQPTLPARGATMLNILFPLFVLFQPTLPARGATEMHQYADANGSISTHAPREGSDRRGWP